MLRSSCITKDPPRPFCGLPPTVREGLPSMGCFLYGTTNIYWVRLFTTHLASPPLRRWQPPFAGGYGTSVSTLRLIH